MKHFEIKNLKINLDNLLQHIVESKITNSYLNYGLIRNNKILTKAVENIDEASPKQLKEIETSIYQNGLKEFEKLVKKEKLEIENLSEIGKQNKIFNLGFSITQIN